MNQLRERIVTAIEANGFATNTVRGWSEALADAVIEALNLSVAVEYLSVDGTRRNYMLAGHYTVEVCNE